MVHRLPPWTLWSGINNMYKAILRDKQVEGDKIRVWVVFDNGLPGKKNITVNQDFLISTEGSLVGEIQNRIDRLELLDSFMSKDNLKDIVLPTTDSITTEQERMGEFMDSLNKLRRLKEYLDLGLIKQETYDLFKDATVLLGQQAGEL